MRMSESVSVVMNAKLKSEYATRKKKSKQNVSGEKKTTSFKQGQNGHEIEFAILFHVLENLTFLAVLKRGIRIGSWASDGSRTTGVRRERLRALGEPARATWKST